MRPEISNELLLQVIQAWDPANADKWKFDIGCLVWDGWGIRHSEKDLFAYNEESVWNEASKLVEFLLKDRLDLELCHGRCPRETKEKSLESFGAFWDSDPWGPCTPPISVVNRIKSYEYLKAWKEGRETPTKVCQADEIQARLDRGEKIRGESLYLEKPIQLFPNSVVEGCSIESKLSSWWQCKLKGPLPLTPGEAVVGYSAPAEIPATYEQLCPYCNGSKEVTGWLGKESCQACG